MQRWLFISFVMFFCLCVAAWAQEAAPISPLSTDARGTSVPPEFIREWLVLGPFFPDDLEKDFLAHAGGEANIEPREGDAVNTSDGRILTWKRYKSEKRIIIDLLDAIGDYEYATAYAFCILQNETAGDAEFRLGSDDGVAVWINGQQVHNNPVARGVTFDEDVFEVNLKAGANRCLVKVSQRVSTWGFAMRGATLEAWERMGPGIPAGPGTVVPAGEGTKVSVGWERGYWRTFDGADGLANNHVWVVFQDRDGNLWFGTESGASRYDGQKFTTFTTKDGLAHNIVISIFQDRDGNLWFGTLSGGVSRYDGREWTTFTTDDGLGGNDVGAILQDGKGDLWFGISGRVLGSGGGVSRYNGRQWITFTTEDGLAGNYVKSIIQDSDGNLWFGAVGGVTRYDGQTFATFTKEDGLASDGVDAVFQDRAGYFWFGTGGGVCRYDGQTFTTFTPEDGLVDNAVWSICQDRQGYLWFGTPEGVSRYDGEEWTNFTTKDGLATNFVMSLFEDREGYIWFATWGGGVSRYDSRMSAILPEEGELTDAQVRLVYQDREGHFWFGTFTGGGVIRYDGQTFTTFTTEDGLADDEVHSILQDRDGHIWFGTGGGVSRYDGQIFTSFTGQDGLAWGSVRSIAQDEAGNLWFGISGSGISRYDGQTFANFTTQDGLAHRRVWSILVDQSGRIWVGHGFFGPSGGGVSRYDGKKWAIFTTEDGLAHNNVRSVFQDREGNLWFSTFGGGVSRYDGQTFTTFTTKNGLAHNVVWSTFQDRQGHMWFCTHGGACRYDGQVFQRLTKQDGLPSNHVCSMYEDRDGYLIAASNTVTRFRPPAPSPPPVFIDAVVADRRYEGLNAVEVPSSVGLIAFEFSGRSLKTRPEAMVYRYRLVGYDEAWKNTNNRHVEYEDIPKGSYTFEVLAVDRDLVYSEQPASVRLAILAPPFYRRAGFIIGTILAAFFIPSGISAVLLTRKKKQEFVPIPNPYIVGNPIRSKGMFFGRRSDFEFVRMKLGSEEAGLVIVFAGERRSGKTSILFQILNGELGERFVPVLLDMQAMTVDSEAEFFERMASGINEALVRVGINPTSTEFQEGNPTRTFERFMVQIMEALDGKGLLLLMDEYELIEVKIDDGILRPDLITFFASLLEAHPRLSFIFTGSRHLERRNPAYWQILIGKSLYRHISFLSQRDALRLITEPVKEQVVYPRGIPERIVRLTAGQPFYTQVVCQNLMDRLNEVQRNRVRQGDIDAVAQELADNPLPQMIYFWDGLEQEQQSALSLLGEVLEDSARYASAKMLLSFAQEQNLETRHAVSLQLERVLDELFVRDILERERAGEGQYEYRFRVDLFRLWVRQAHSVWQQT